MKSVHAENRRVGTRQHRIDSCTSFNLFLAQHAICPASVPLVSSIHSEVDSTYQIRQTVQLLPHQAALPPPPRHLAIHEVEKQSKGDERKGDVDVRVPVRRAQGVAQGGEDGHEAAETLR